jgi:DnaK suppressor protein
MEVTGMPMRAAMVERLKQKLLLKRRELLSEVREQYTSNLETGNDGIQDIADQATTAYTKEFLLSIGDAERQLLKQVDAALEKIRLKKYGQCERCGEKIGEKRLEALPFARFCIACQEEEERR